METKKEINFFRRTCEYGWMSNFYGSSMIIDGIEYQTNEHYYQSQKTSIPELQEKIRNQPTPFLAMVTGRSLKPNEFRKDWEEIKVEVMLKGIRQKFKDPDLRDKLFDTRGSIIHEDNPKDLFWGKNGKDMLGKLLMQVRKEFIQELKEAAKRSSEEIQKIINDPEFIEKSEQFAREISRITPEELLRPFDI